MRRPLLLASALMLSLATLPATAAPSRSPSRWMEHVRVLADDNMEGRLTGTPGYERAAAYVAQQFAKLGVKPAGTDGYMQQVPLLEQTLDIAASSLALVGPAGETALALGDTVLPGNRVPQPPAAFDAPLVFIGYGLHLPEAGYDDFAGLDLKGKIAVTLAGGPQNISGALKSHASRAELWPALQRAGAIGLVTVANPNHMDVPWERQKLFVGSPGMRIADATLNDAKSAFLTAAFSPAQAELLFRASGHRFADLVALADKGAQLPRFNLNQQLKGRIVATDRPLSAPNVVGRIPGSDRKLAGEYVVLTAHLDHLGVGQPVNGDSIYNGAMDNASGIASMLETARNLKREKPKRSILLVAVTGEERGLLGSRYFANRPTVPADAIAANINMDMYLPLWPFTHVTALGAEESTLGPISAAVAQSLGVQQLPDDQPERNLFVRSDQYSFVRTGVPALALKFAAVSPEEKALQKQWLTDRYHAPQDDLSQPIEPAYAEAFNRYLDKLILTIANTPERPHWNETSFFKRFTRPQ